MRGNRGQRGSIDLNTDYEPRVPTRRKDDSIRSPRDIREVWEPMICPECGAEHPNPSTVRVRKVGQDYEARCLTCGAITARYIDGVWIS
jgi:RNase P subunit RPR2